MMPRGQLYIYTLEGCKTCQRRQGRHNEVSDLLKGKGIETIGVLFGMIDGQRYEPMEEHDNLCRKPDDPMKYTSPVYILDIPNGALVKLTDLDAIPSSKGYAQYVLDTMKRATSE